MQYLRAHAAETASVLKVLANENRLLILCQLVDGSCNVRKLNQTVPFLSQSALSQHLARLREAGFVSCSPQGSNMVYSLSDPRVRELLAHLRDLYSSLDPGEERPCRPCRPGTE